MTSALDSITALRNNMKSIRVLLVGAFALGTCLGFSQTWSTAYAAGLKAARALQWSDARQAFLQAAAIRPEDASQATTLPGPITERRQWRNGAPYSPNFLAAYSAFRNAVTVKDRQAQAAMLHTVAEELQVLIDKSEESPVTLYYLNAAYSKIGDSEKAQALMAKGSQPDFKMDWRVDTEVVDPQELAQINSMVSAMQRNQDVIAAQQPQTGKTGKPSKGARNTDPSAPIPAGTQPGANQDLPSGTTIISAPILGPVTQNPNKFALLIGNSASRLGDDQIPYAGDDAQRLREALVHDGGYAESNVDLVLNATSDQVMAEAKAMADRVSEGSTVFIYFSGVGVNVDGRDYLTGVEAESATSTSGMVAKNDLYRMFMMKGAHIFAFYQANRTVSAGRFFGMEVPLVGSISQCQATSPGKKVTSIMRNGKAIGIYTDAFASVLNDLRSSTIPIVEFEWQVFYRMRRGDTGTTGGGSPQTPTLPVLTNMATDARF